MNWPKAISSALGKDIDPKAAKFWVRIWLCVQGRKEGLRQLELEAETLSELMAEVDNPEFFREVARAMEAVIGERDGQGKADPVRQWLAFEFNRGAAKITNLTVRQLQSLIRERAKLRVGERTLRRICTELGIPLRKDQVGHPRAQRIAATAENSDSETAKHCQSFRPRRIVFTYRG
jgi:hypothetical protein